LAWGGGCGLDSTGSGQRLVAGCCECSDEPSGSCAMKLDDIHKKCKLCRNCYPLMHLVSNLLSNFWMSHTVTITFVSNLVMAKLTFIWMASQTYSCRIWATENLLHAECVTVWCGIYLTDVMCPDFFDNKMGTVPMVTGAVITTFSHCSETWWWIKNGTFSSNKMVQSATLQGNQWLASDSCYVVGWFPNMENLPWPSRSPNFFSGATWSKGYSEQSWGHYRK
jgi:hypothetical protein